MNVRFMDFDHPIRHILHDMPDHPLRSILLNKPDQPFRPILNMIDATVDDSDGNKSARGGPSRTYVWDARPMAATLADLKEYPNSYTFVIDMLGLKPDDIKVQVEDNVLIISGERKREEEKEVVEYESMERRTGKFMSKFELPENPNTDKIMAVCRDGVLTVTVEKLPPPEPKKPKTIEVKIA